MQPNEIWDIESKVDWLFQRAQIAELVYRYTHAVDDGDWAGWQSLFTDDGAYVSRKGAVPKAELARAGERLLSPYVGSHHMIGQLSMTIDGADATGRCYYLVHHVKVSDHPSQSDIVGGWYLHRYRRTPDGWKFVEVRGVPSWSEGGSFWNPPSEG